MQGSEGTNGASERLARRELVLLRLEQRRREAQRRRAGARTALTAHREDRGRISLPA